MQLHLVLASLEPAAFSLPAVCPGPICTGTEFRLHQQVRKPLKDALHQTVMVYRYRCTRCGHTFRVYPQGVTRAHTSRNVQDIAVILYLLGLSFGTVSAALDSLGVYLSKSRVYETVHAVMQHQPLLTRSNIFAAIQSQSYQHGRLRVHCMERWLPLTLTTNPCSRLVLTVTPLSLDEIAVLQSTVDLLMTALGGRVVTMNTHASCDEQALPQSDDP